jgi:hypothetical protein
MRVYLGMLLVQVLFVQRSFMLDDLGDAIRTGAVLQRFLRMTGVALSHSAETRADGDGPAIAQRRGGRMLCVTSGLS